MHRPLLIITGASRGIGRTTAAFFRDAGWNVLGIARGRCPEPGVESLSVDLGQLAAVTELGAELRQRAQSAPKVALIHNAAHLEKDSVESLTAESLQTVLTVNVLAPQVLNQSLLPSLRPGSSILWVGSTLASQAVAGAHSYITSKHAQLGQMRALAQDLRGRSIHTAMISPGFTDTEMLRTHLLGDTGALQAAAAHSLYGRLVDPHEIAAVLLFAANHPVLNGSVIDASLGQVGR